MHEDSGKQPLTYYAIGFGFVFITLPSVAGLVSVVLRGW